MIAATVFGHLCAEVMRQGAESGALGAVLRGPSINKFTKLATRHERETSKAGHDIKQEDLSIDQLIRRTGQVTRSELHDSDWKATPVTFGLDHY